MSAHFVRVSIFSEYICDVLAILNSMLPSMSAVRQRLFKYTSYTSIANQCENSGTSTRFGQMYFSGSLAAEEADNYV